MVDNIILQLQHEYLVLRFYPTYYDKSWHVSIRDGAIEYRLYDYKLRLECVKECRRLNRKYNV